MSDGIIFYSNFQAVAPLLAVALHSLRKNYDGNIHVTLGDATPESFVDMIKANKDVTYDHVHKRYYEKDPGKNSLRGWLEKPYIIKNSPFERTVYFDCDHVFYNKFDKSIFNLISEHNIVSSVPFAFASRHGKILKQVNKVAGYELEKIPRASGACVGYLKSSGIVDKWIEHMHLFRDHGGDVLKSNSEEFALATILVLGYGKHIPPKWSANAAKDGSLNDTGKDADAIHFVSKRYSKGNLWKDALAECVKDNYMGIKDNAEEFLKMNRIAYNFLQQNDFREKCNL
jgi:hypothetical protein